MTVFIWTKEKLEYLLLHGPSEKIIVMAQHLECSSESVYLKIKRLGILRSRSHGMNRPENKRTKHALAAMDKLNEERRVPWPQITTTMGMAMDGRTFGGDPAKPGTAKPKQVRTRWVGDIGEAKSSMGNR